MILNEEFDFLKVKPMPKKKENYNFFLNKKQPNVIDKTETETFDEIDFFKKIQDKLNIKTFNKIESLKKQTESIDKIVEDKIKYFLIKNIQKTDIKIIIKQIEDAKKDTKKDTIKKERETKNLILKKY
tara:strand:+ start:369 stop:752 length:384 start_codon:yes stop_codon:yes gene_type:complete